MDDNFFVPGAVTKGAVRRMIRDSKKSVLDSLPATILTNPHVIVSGGETYLNVTYDMAELVDGVYGTTPKTVSIPSANPATNRAGLMSGPDKKKLDGIEEGANNYVLPVASPSVRGGVVLNTAWQTPTLDSEDADGKNVPFEMANESSGNGILKPACKVYVDNEPTSGSNHLMTSGGLCKAIDKAKRQVFIDLWNQACNYNGTVYGKYDPINALAPDKPFMLYGLWFSYSEALHIYNISYKEYVLKPAKLYYGISYIELPAAFLPLKVLSHSGESCERVFSGNINLKACHIAGGQDNIYGSSDWRSTFEGCANLETIYGGVRPLYSSPRVTDCFKGCSALKEVVISLRYSGINISLVDSPLISLQSLQNSIATSVYTESANTITVHPDVYAKLTGDTTNEAAAALTEEEAAAWQQIVVDAAAKNISFATV